MVLGMTYTDPTLETQHNIEALTKPDDNITGWRFDLLNDARKAFMLHVAAGRTLTDAHRLSIRWAAEQQDIPPATAQHELTNLKWAIQ